MKGEEYMEIRFTFGNGSHLTTKTSAPTMEAFMEEFAMITSQVFGEKGKYMSKYGEFLDVYGFFIRFSDVILVQEVFEGGE
jgi:hypothetical protein